MGLFYYTSLFIVLSCLIFQGDSIKCYICSFSPDDRNNRTDKCTDDNFQHQHVYSDECKLGCESVVQYDLNDEMEHWRRNCLQDGHEMTNDCETETTIGFKLIRCTCKRDLCNQADRPSLGNIPLLFASLTFLWYNFFLIPR